MNNEFSAGNPKHSIECLRRALHYSPSSVKDVGYVGLANVFHRHGYMTEAVIMSRASLDVTEDSVSVCVCMCLLHPPPPPLLFQSVDVCSSEPN